MAKKAYTIKKGNTYKQRNRKGKKETVEEFLARGGKITVLPPSHVVEDVVVPNHVSPSTVSGGTWN